ncbi:hypothetical protein, partial [Pseudomonas paracarnis]
NAIKNMGAGLPAIAVCQAIHVQLIDRYRRQASSHSGSVLNTSIAVTQGASDDHNKIDHGPGPGEVSG